MSSEQEPQNAYPPFEPVKRIEEILLGFLHFGAKFFYTLRDLGFNKKAFSKAIRENSLNVTYSNPTIFVTLLNFLTVRVFRFGFLTILLVLPFSTRSCSKVTYTEITPPSFGDEITIPSFTDVVLYAIPTLVVVLIVSRFLRFVLVKDDDVSKARISAIVYYSVGFQYLSYLIVLALLYLFFQFETLEKITNIPLAFWEKIAGIPFFSIPLFFLWIVWIFSSLVSKSVEKKNFRISKSGVRKVLIFICSLVLIVVTTASEMGFAYLLAFLESQQTEALPVLDVKEVGIQETESFQSVLLLVKNNSHEKKFLLSDEVYIFPGEECLTSTYSEGLPCRGKIVDSGLGIASVITINPQDVEWISVFFEIPASSLPLFYRENLIQFNSFSTSGGKEMIGSCLIIENAPEYPLPAEEEN